MEMMRTYCLEFMSCYLAILLLAIAVSGQPAELPKLENGSNSDTVDVNIESWQGVATKGYESHPIRLNIESIRPIDPAEARILLESNASLGEIRSSLRVGDKVPIRAGNMKLDNNIYRLINIVIARSDSDSTLSADVIGPIAGPRSGPNKSSAKAGQVTIKLSSNDYVISDEGNLVMNNSEYRGTYRLMLERQFPGRGPRAGLKT